MYALRRARVVCFAPLLAVQASEELSRRALTGVGGAVASCPCQRRRSCRVVPLPASEELSRRPVAGGKPRNRGTPKSAEGGRDVVSRKERRAKL